MNAAVLMAHIYTSNIGNRAIYYISILTLSLNLQTVHFELKPCANDLTFGLTFHLTFAMRSSLMLAKCANEPNISPNI